MTDYTKILDRLLPRPDGEATVRHRAGVVTALNSDGTVDVEISGVEIPSVSCLAGTPVDVGDIVQIVAWRGDLLVLGRARDSEQDGPRGVLGYAQATANQSGIGATFTALTGLSVTVTHPPGRRIKLTAQVEALVDTVSDTTIQLVILDTTTPETLQSARQRPVGNNRSATLHSAIVHDPDPGTFTYSLSMRREVGSGNVTMVADSANKSFLLVEDIGAAP